MNNPRVLEPALESPKKFKVSKSNKVFKNTKKKKKKYWNDEIKSNKSYNDVEKIAFRKAKEHFHQEKS